MWKEIANRIEQADVVNFAAILFILATIILAGVHVHFISLTETPAETFQMLLNWFIPIASEIFLAYGLTRKAG